MPDLELTIKQEGASVIMSESERELEGTKRKILTQLGFARHVGYTLEQYDRRENQMTVQRISQQIGLDAARVERAVASLVAEGKVKQILGEGEDYYLLPECK